VSKGERPAVVSASIGASGRYEYVKTAIDRTVSEGVVVVVAAGNYKADACNYSPAYVPSAINVGATSNNDKRWKSSNYGTCLDIFAPGDQILSTGHASDTAQTYKKGTSMACPHVAGAAALLLQKEPNLAPSVVASRIVSGATSNVVTDAGIGSPNKLLYVAPQTTTTTTTTKCINTDARCTTKWNINKCHKKIVQKNCPLMCGTCNGGKPECKNLHPKCDTPKWENKCHKRIVKRNCPLMCGICTA